MPIIASASVQVFGNDDKTIRIIREEIGKHGCVDAAQLSESTGSTESSLKHILRALSGEGLQCSSDMVICCADRERLERFTKKLQILRRG